MFTKKLLSYVLGCLCAVIAFSSHGYGAHWTKFECQAIPGTGANSYDTTVKCVAQITRPGSSKWYNAYKQHCPTFCAGLGGANVPSPDGFACTSGEERPWSAINAGVDYSPTGCWHDCRLPEGSPGAQSERQRCYHPNQKRDNDVTDLTVGCFCETGDIGTKTTEVTVRSGGVAAAQGVSATPSGWSRIDKNILNSSPEQLVDIAGEIPLGGTGEISMVVKVQGACGTSALLRGSFANPSGAQISSPDVSIPLPACPAQCKDGIDNDGDGAIDIADFSCQGDPDRDDESNPQASCQDGVDNDNDGLTDLADPGCRDSQDNDESDEAALLTVGVRCVFDNQDGTFTAYFDYNNTGKTSIEVPKGVTDSTRNDFCPGCGDRGQPTVFVPGLNKGALPVVFDGADLTWSVRAAGSALSQATASKSSPECAHPQPIAECINGSASGIEVTYGYRNPNDFALAIPHGILNYFSPAPANRGQPTTLKPGLNSAAFTTGLTERMMWNLDGTSAAVTSETPICPGGCVDTPVGTIKSELNQSALDLAALTKRAARVLAKRAQQRAKSGLLSSSAASRASVDAVRASKKADQMAKRANELTIGIPEVITSCPFSPPYCETIDRTETIKALRALYADMLNQVKRIMARSNFRASGDTSRQDPLVIEGKRLKALGDTQLDELPRTATDCA